MEYQFEIAIAVKRDLLQNKPSAFHNLKLGFEGLLYFRLVRPIGGWKKMLATLRKVFDISMGAAGDLGSLLSSQATELNKAVPAGYSPL